ncbi:hypothetical protein [Dyella subtropica]|uniref:hypothetical protein n=1 Tax=Dyella subtropica TaxID=2992127 RepID=UPI00224EF5AE|nr:hypothetical protein [Dyella subtropica]
MSQERYSSSSGWWVLIAAFVATTTLYWPGLSGTYLFDDYPNIVDNPGVHPSTANVPSLVRAALSSPASDFKRPLASLSFAINYLTTGLNPYWMKLTNLAIHLLNGLLVFLLARMLLAVAAIGVDGINNPTRRQGMLAALIAGAWLLLPINLTPVLYVVQRMESLANLFVLLGLIGYLVGRRHMLGDATITANPGQESRARNITGRTLCLVSLVVPTGIGLLAKETAVMLPLYAVLIEWIVLKFRALPEKKDKGLIALFLLILALPLAIGMAWLLPGIMRPETWASRDFSLGTRLLSECRVVIDYIGWTLLPTPSALSFYHDDFLISTSLLSPWTTLLSLLVLGWLIALALWSRNRQPLVALGIALYLGCHLLTATVLPLELIYEHRNYFASFGLLLALIPTLVPSHTPPESAIDGHRPIGFALPRYVLMAGLLLSWTVLTAMTAQAWGNPLRLAEELAARAPQSPRAQYELGRTYIVYSHYDPASPFTKLAYPPLEAAAGLPQSSILPEQALIFMNSRMHLPLSDAWWDSMIAKLKSHKPGIQDESSLGALTQCARDHHCELPTDRMIEAFMAALSHPNPTARLLAMYGDYAWNVLDDHSLGLHMIEEAVQAQPSESAYQVTKIKMLVSNGDTTEARHSLDRLRTLNIGGSLDETIAEMDKLSSRP